MQVRKVFLVFALARLACGQSSVPVIGSADYLSPAPLTVAPGQLLTLFVPGLGNGLSVIVKAPAGPLPTTLAGVTAVLRQRSSDHNVPILEVQPIKSCTTVDPPSNSCGALLAVTVQIPSDIETVCPLCERPDTQIPSQIGLSVNGVQGPLSDVIVVPDQVHFVTACDVIMAAPKSVTTGLPCAPIVTHADGQFVSAANPAKSGEELTAYATGLGQTKPQQTTGQLATGAAVTLTTFAMDFNYRPNSLATKPRGASLTGPSSGPTPRFTGTTAGFVGLYQVNFVVPSPPGELAPCSSGTSQKYANVVQSNLTVSIGSVFSFDGAGICVASSM